MTRVDVPDGQVHVPFVDCDVDPSLQQALGQAEPAVGYRHPKTVHRPGPDDGSSLSLSLSASACGAFGTRM